MKNWGHFVQCSTADTSLLVFPKLVPGMEGTRESSSAERWVLDLHLPPALQVGQGTTAQLGHSRHSLSFAKQGRDQIFPDYWKASGDTVNKTDHNSSLSFSATAWRGDLSLPRSVAELEPGFGTEQDSKQIESCFADVPTLPTPCDAAFTSAPAIVQLSKESLLGMIENASTGEAVASHEWGEECCSMVSTQLTAPRP